MKKIYLFLFFTCFISVYSVDARTTAEVLDLPVSNAITAGEYDIEVIINALEDMGFKVEELKINGPEEEEKECRMTIKGTYDEKEVDLVIVIKGQTCAELLKGIMKS